MSEKLKMVLARDPKWFNEKNACPVTHRVSASNKLPLC